MAKSFGIPEADIQVIVPFIGGGFGESRGGTFGTPPSNFTFKSL